jgi:hypothetical protein
MSVSLPNLDNLVRVRKLKAEPPARKEIDGLLRSAGVRLKDAANTALSHESRFDLTYNAAHELALAALRWHGYRSENRYLVFRCLADTVGMSVAQWRVLARCHERRNVMEYEGDFDIDDQLMADLEHVTALLQKKVIALGPLAQV